MEYILDLVNNKGPQDVISYLKSIVGSPLISHEAWDTNTFDFKNLFYQPPLFATVLFLGHELNRCSDPRNSSNRVLCLKITNDFKFDMSSIRSDIAQVFVPLKLDKAMIKVAVNNFVDFIKFKQNLEENLKNRSERKILKIRDLRREFPQLNVDWLKVVNDQMMSEEKMTEDDVIGIENPELVRQLLASISSYNKRF